MENLKRRLENYEVQVLKLGITGGTAVGKSSFINMLLDLKEKDKDFAKTGFGDTTMNVKTYSHYKQKRFTVTDMPGYGTLTIPQDEFLKRVKLSEFDYCLIFFETVLKTDDAWIATKLLEMKIPFSLVRTKLDLFLDQVKQEKQDANKAVTNLRRDLENSKNQLDIFKNIKLFIISNKEHYEEGDLTELIEEIASILPDEKTESFLFYLPVYSIAVIEMKYKELEKRVKKAALATCAIAAIPIPGVDCVANLAIIERELKAYFIAFDLDKDDIESVPGLSHSLCRNGGMRLDWNFFFRQSIGQFSQLATAAIISQVDVLIPVVGSMVAGYANYKLIYSYLLSNLKELKQDALRVYHYKKRHDIR